MEVFEYGSLTARRRSELEGGELNPFGSVEPPLQWRAKDHHIGLRDADGRAVASLGFVRTQVRVAGGEPFDVLGIGGVIVAPAYRGQGHSRTVIEAALARAQTLGPAIALLFCFADKVALYERFGFALVQAHVCVQQPRGTAAHHVACAEGRRELASRGCRGAQPALLRLLRRIRGAAAPRPRGAACATPP